MGRILIITGIIILVMGIFIHLGGRIPFLGRLPGDIVIKKGSSSFYFPVVTSIVVSIVITVLINLILKLFR